MSHPGVLHEFVRLYMHLDLPIDKANLIFEL